MPDPQHDIDLERGRAEFDRVIAAGGTAMQAALASIGVAFDAEAAARSRARRAARGSPLAVPINDNDPIRTFVVIDSLPRRHPSPQPHAWDVK